MIAGGVFLVLVVIAAVMLFGGSGSGKPSAKTSTAPSVGASSSSAAPGKAQADAIYALIQQSKPLRSEANGAVSDVEACKGQSKAQATFADVASKRQAQADQVKALPVDKMPAGAAKLVSDLQKSWQFSADSENELAAWAGDNLSCTGKSNTTANRTRADSDGGHAGTYKADAAADWNAMAAALGEPTIDISQL